MSTDNKCPTAEMRPCPADAQQLLKATQTSVTEQQVDEMRSLIKWQQEFIFELYNTAALLRAYAEQKERRDESTGK